MQHDTVLVLVSLTNVLFFSGIMFGWAPFLVMLEEEGQYAEVCAGAEGGCADQAARFALIFAVATFLVNGISLPSGILLDRCGGGAMTALAAACTGGGLAMLGASDSRALDLFLPGYALVTVGGQATLFSALPAAFLLPGRQTLVLALVSCLFDGSCVVFQVLSSLRHATGATRRELAVGYALFSVPCFAAQAASGRAARRAPAEEAAVHDYGSINSEAPEGRARPRNGRGAQARVEDLPPRSSSRAPSSDSSCCSRRSACCAQPVHRDERGPARQLRRRAPGPHERLYSRLFGPRASFGRGLSLGSPRTFGARSRPPRAPGTSCRRLPLRPGDRRVGCGSLRFGLQRDKLSRSASPPSARPMARVQVGELPRVRALPRVPVRRDERVHRADLRPAHARRITGCVFTFGAVVNLRRRRSSTSDRLGGDTDPCPGWSPSGWGVRSRAPLGASRPGRVARQRRPFMPRAGMHQARLLLGRLPSVWALSACCIVASNFDPDSRLPGLAHARQATRGSPRGARRRAPRAARRRAARARQCAAARPRRGALPARDHRPLDAADAIIPRMRKATRMAEKASAGCARAVRRETEWSRS